MGKIVRLVQKVYDAIEFKSQCEKMCQFNI